MKGDYDILYGSQLAFRVRGQDDSMRRWLEKTYGRRCFAEPDDHRRILLEIQYEKNISMPNGTCRVGQSAGWTADGFCVSEGYGWAILPMENLLSNVPFIIRCQENFDPSRLLGYIIETILTVRALLHGFLFVHSSAVVMDGEALVFPAWGNTGKTNLVLSMTLSGATILSDDWCVLCPGRKVAGVPRPLNLLNYNLRVFPEYKRGISPMMKLMLLGDSLLFQFNKHFGEKMQGIPMRIMGVASQASELLTNIKVPLADNFPVGMDLSVRAIIALNKYTGQLCDDNPQPITRETLLSKLSSCFMFENIRLLRRIWEWQFLCPAGSATLIESIRQLHDLVAKARLAEFGDVDLMQFSMPASLNKERWDRVGRDFLNRFFKR